MERNPGWETKIIPAYPSMVVKVQRKSGMKSSLAARWLFPRYSFQRVYIWTPLSTPIPSRAGIMTTLKRLRCIPRRTIRPKVKTNPVRRGIITKSDSRTETSSSQTRTKTPKNVSPTNQKTSLLTIITISAKTGVSPTGPRTPPIPILSRSAWSAGTRS